MESSVSRDIGALLGAADERARVHVRAHVETARVSVGKSCGEMTAGPEEP